MISNNRERVLHLHGNMVMCLFPSFQIVKRTQSVVASMFLVQHAINDICKFHKVDHCYNACALTYFVNKLLSRYFYHEVGIIIFA